MTFNIKKQHSISQRHYKSCFIFKHLYFKAAWQQANDYRPLAIYTVEYYERG